MMMIKTIAMVVALALGAGGLALGRGLQDKKRPGYSDTPTIPGQSWKVHDSERPYPPVVTPAETPGAPPSDAIVLFDGKDLSRWAGTKGGDAGWKVENGYVECVAKAGDIQTRDSFGDFQLHLEWASPVEAKGESQGRGNSGAFLHGRYEVQVIDSFENPTYADGQASALYGQWPPLANAARRPGEWQTYDIAFTAARFKDGKLERPARVTVFHNGVVVHHAREFTGPTRHKTAASESPYDGKGPIRLQDHGNPVRFRSIWIRPLSEN